MTGRLSEAGLLPGEFLFLGVEVVLGGLWRGAAGQFDAEDVPGTDTEDDDVGGVEEIHPLPVPTETEARRVEHLIVAPVGVAVAVDVLNAVPSHATKSRYLPPRPIRLPPGRASPSGRRTGGTVRCERRAR